MSRSGSGTHMCGFVGYLNQWNRPVPLGSSFGRGVPPQSPPLPTPECNTLASCPFICFVQLLSMGTRIRGRYKVPGRRISLFGASSLFVADSILDGQSKVTLKHINTSWEKLARLKIEIISIFLELKKTVVYFYMKLYGFFLFFISAKLNWGDFKVRLF